jgi:hypothetical protein
MRQGLLIAALSAAASGLLFLSLVTGSAAGPVVAYFVQLPVLFCGLALGLAPAALASAGAAVVVLAAGGAVAALLFALIEAAPALLLVRQTLLWRQDGVAVEWYPIGKVLTDLVAAATVAGLAMLLWVAAGEGGIVGVFDRLLATLPPEVPRTGPIAQAHALLVRWAEWVPGIVAGSWLLMTIVNAVLAQALAVRGGLARRPSPAMASFEAPGWCAAPLLVAAAAAALTTGTVAAAAALVMILFATPYFFQGLAVLHALVRKRTGSSLPLVALYVLLVVFSWPLAPLLVLLGLAEEWAGLRRRIA